MDAEFHQSSQVTKALLRELSQRRDRDGILRFVVHYGLFLGTATWLALSHGQPWWHTLLAMVCFAATTPSLFAMLHESGHNTAFASRNLNRIVAAIAAYSNFYIPSGFREFHFQHHRHTHDPHRDPEISIGGKPATAFMESPLMYIGYLSGLPLLLGKIGLAVTPAFGVYNLFYYYVAQERRSRLGWEARIFVLLHAAIIVGACTVLPGLWLLYPGYLLGMMILSIYLPAEHSGLPHTGTILERTRHIRTTGLVRFMLWNMPYHAEHHAYPGIPFYHLPALYKAMQSEVKEGDKDVPMFQAWMFRRLLRRQG
jgi:fatty acid desaturase